MRMLGMICVAVVMAVTGYFWTGCESAGGADGISLSPASVTLGSNSSSNATSAVVITAQVSGDLALPLQWRVSDSSLGSIISAAGSNATYRANSGRKGDNIVSVTDQYGNEGSAVVTQQ